MDANTETMVPMLSIDAWRYPDGWQWNAWYRIGEVPLAWCDLPARELFVRLREHAPAWPKPGRCTIEDDGHNIVILARGTREPLFALAYGEVEP